MAPIACVMALSPLATPVANTVPVHVKSTLSRYRGNEIIDSSHFPETTRPIQLRADLGSPRLQPRNGRRVVGGVGAAKRRQDVQRLSVVAGSLVACSLFSCRVARLAVQPLPWNMASGSEPIDVAAVLVEEVPARVPVLNVFQPCPFVRVTKAGEAAVVLADQLPTFKPGIDLGIVESDQFPARLTTSKLPNDANMPTTAGK